MLHQECIKKTKAIASNIQLFSRKKKAGMSIDLPKISCHR